MESLAPTLVQVRAALPELRYAKRPAIGVLLVVGLLAAYCVLFVATLLAPWLWLKLVLAVATGGVIGVLFVSGHDASHGSLCHGTAANRWLARLAFLPSAHPNETWDSEHNRQHHSWTNLATKDPVYTPLTLEQYQQLSVWRRVLHRFSLSLPGIWLAYLGIWWNGQIRIRPGRREMVRSISTFRLEVLAILVFAGVQAVLAMQYGSWAVQGGEGRLVAEWTVSIVLPFTVWNWVMAFVTLQHHTHPRVRWYDNEEEWSVFAAQVQGTVHMRWPRWFELLFLNIFDHTAHHADKQVPLHRIAECQKSLEAAFPADIIVESGGLRHMLRMLRTCRLYDYRAHRWMDWDGRYTTV